jgi:hypothetical protein
VPEETPGQPDEVIVDPEQDAPVPEVDAEDDPEPEPVGPVEQNPDLPPDGC